MQIKNYEDISNGDIGYVVQIRKDGSDALLTVDFGDGRVVEYENNDLDMLTHAYATTIHKSRAISE